MLNSKNILESCIKNNFKIPKKTFKIAEKSE